MTTAPVLDLSSASDVLPAFMEWGRKGYFQTQVIEGYSSQGARGVYCFRGTGSRETLTGMLAGWEAL
ncbi:hypothetical protein EJB05_27275 [Eragrostis curvula]|uniref:Uncharacterized protein n=1 Tax=Eragrostis curvula TaxID=38414 RepID=A0A5J9UMZ3_9POAL|nr:hypothetical protein EJB05_27275 [Eragrostis curvula]